MLYLAILLRFAGADVTVLEAKGKLAGCALSNRMEDGTELAMGMMRFGRGQATWGQIIAELGFDLTHKFPNPGVVTTLVAYESTREIWNPNSDVPKLLRPVLNHWNDFLNNGFGDLKGWHEIRKSLGEKSYKKKETQLWYDTFRGKSFGELVQTVFESKWSKTDFRIFDMLGIGTGGFGAFNPASIFLIMRVIVNGFEDCQFYITKNEDSRDRFVSPQEVVQGLGKKAEETGVEIKLNQTATRVHEPTNEKIMVSVRDGNVYKSDRIIVGTTFPAARKIHGLSNFIDRSVFEAMKTGSDGRSGKLFAIIDVSTIEEIKKDDFPLTLISDKKIQQVYVLPAKSQNKRAVLMWYYHINTARLLRSTLGIRSAVS